MNKAHCCYNEHKCVPQRKNSNERPRDIRFSSSLGCIVNLVLPDSRIHVSYKGGFVQLWTRNSEWRERGRQILTVSEQGKWLAVSIHYRHRIESSIACIPRVKTIAWGKGDKQSRLHDSCPPLMLTNAPHSEQNGVLLQSEQSQWTASDSQDQHFVSENPSLMIAIAEGD